jgi:hypothetical protein
VASFKPCFINIQELRDATKMTKLMGYATEVGWILGDQIGAFDAQIALF